MVFYGTYAVPVLSVMMTVSAAVIAALKVVTFSGAVITCVQGYSRETLPCKHITKKSFLFKFFSTTAIIKYGSYST